MNLKVSFSWIGLVVFALPMLINIAYAIFPPKRKGGTDCGDAVLKTVAMEIARISFLTRKCVYL